MHDLLPSPAELKQRLPLSTQGAATVAELRREAAAIVEGCSRRIALLIGPCSIDRIDAAIAYGEKLAALPLPPFFPLLRFFTQKSRTELGWKGFLYTSSRPAEALISEARDGLVRLIEKGIGAAAELLDPFLYPYFDDLLIWGVIGARTASSQIHRELAARAPFPVGFKNDLAGSLERSLNSLRAAEAPQFTFGLTDEGRVERISAPGNRHAHLILRGSDQGPNYSHSSIQKAVALLAERGFAPRLLIDCSHGNLVDGLPFAAFSSTLTLIQETDLPIRGMMLESYLQPGRCRGPLSANGVDLAPYGVSRTDPCIGWGETEELLLAASSALSSRSTAISSVQK
jgi:3-deoxy-7-phosphoheptulonate synthase